MHNLSDMTAYLSLLLKMAKFENAVFEDLARVEIATKKKQTIKQMVGS